MPVHFLEIEVVNFAKHCRVCTNYDGHVQVRDVIPIAKVALVLFAGHSLLCLLFGLELVVRVYNVTACVTGSAYQVSELIE